MKVWIIEVYTNGDMHILDTAYTDKRVCELRCRDLKKRMSYQSYHPKESEGVQVKSFFNAEGDSIVVEGVYYNLNMYDVPRYVFKRVWDSLDEEEVDALETYFNRL
jgi:hypothetical protein